MSQKLTKNEQERLTSLETTIERGKSAFIEVGQALAEIRDLKLYKATHKSFEVYSQDRWGFTDRHAKRLIESAKIVEEVRGGPIGHVPSNEAQARELADVEPERRQEVWKEAVSRAPVDDKGKPKVTASLIREVAEETAAPPSADTRLDRAREAMMRCDEIKRLFRQLKAEIVAVREEGHFPHITNGLELGIDSLKSQVHDGIPHCSAPCCEGKGCEKCRGRGWLSKMEFGQLSKKDAAKAVEL